MAQSLWTIYLWALVPNRMVHKWLFIAGTHDVPWVVLSRVAVTFGFKLWISVLCVSGKFHFGLLFGLLLTFHSTFMWAVWLGFQTDFWEQSSIRNRLVWLRCVRSPVVGIAGLGEGIIPWESCQNHSWQKVPVYVLCVLDRKILTKTSAKDSTELLL